MINNFLHNQPNLSASEYSFIGLQLAILLVAVFSGLGGYL